LPGPFASCERLSMRRPDVVLGVERLGRLADEPAEAGGRESQLLRIATLSLSGPCHRDRSGASFPSGRLHSARGTTSLLFEPVSSGSGRKAGRMPRDVTGLGAPQSSVTSAVTAIGAPQASLCGRDHPARVGSRVAFRGMSPGSDCHRGRVPADRSAKLRLIRPSIGPVLHPKSGSRLPIRPMRQPKNHHRLPIPPGCRPEKMGLDCRSEPSDIGKSGTSLPKFSRLHPKFCDLSDKIFPA